MHAIAEHLRCKSDEQKRVLDLSLNSVETLSKQVRLPDDVRLVMCLNCVGCFSIQVADLEKKNEALHDQIAILTGHSAESNELFQAGQCLGSWAPSQLPDLLSLAVVAMAVAAAQAPSG